jgi:hypothetical protein
LRQSASRTDDRRLFCHFMLGERHAMPIFPIAPVATADQVSARIAAALAGEDGRRRARF